MPVTSPAVPAIPNLRTGESKAHKTPALTGRATRQTQVSVREQRDVAIALAGLVGARHAKALVIRELEVAGTPSGKTPV